MRDDNNEAQKFIWYELFCGYCKRVLAVSRDPKPMKILCPGCKTLWVMSFERIIKDPPQRWEIEWRVEQPGLEQPESFWARVARWWRERNAG